MQNSNDITGLLLAWQAGDADAYQRLISLTYGHLHELSQNLLRRESQRHRVQPTELLHECALRLLNLSEMSWEDRAHFYAMATTTMRRVLVDQARRFKAEKRAGEELTLVTSHLASGNRPLELEALDQALRRLAELSEEKAQIVELKFFGGLSNREVAAVTRLSVSSVKRQWSAARSWLYTQLSGAL